jgi:HSP20 family protein
MRLTRQPRAGLDMSLARLRDQIDRVFEQPDFAISDFSSGWTPAVDVIDNKDKLIIKAELPGFKREDLEVSLHENNLVISGQRQCEDEKREGEFYRCERYYGKFHRSIPLPGAVDSSKIEAQYRDGVLSVRLPKSEKSKPKQIEIAVA